MTPKTFRRIALSLPEATEGSHFSKADFRIAGKIFATLALEHQGYGVLLLTPDQQAGMIQDAPEIFSPVPGGWGEKGATRVLLKKVPSDIAKASLRVAWTRKAPNARRSALWAWRVLASGAPFRVAASPARCRHARAGYAFAMQSLVPT